MKYIFILGGKIVRNEWLIYTKRENYANGKSVTDRIMLPILIFLGTGF